MAMREHPDSGYIVPLEALKAIIDEQYHAKFTQLMEDGHTEELDEFLDEVYPEGYPSFNVYQPAQEDTVDNMEVGELYAIYDDCDLFIRTRTDSHEKLIEAGIEPLLAHWSVWG